MATARAMSLASAEVEAMPTEQVEVEIKGVDA